jgi:hypothetical protein
MDNLSTRDPLLDDIEQYLARTGMSAQAFGRAALNDSAFMTTLRRGRDVRRSTHMRVRQFMNNNPSGLFKPDR